MDGMMSAMDQQSMVASFLEIAVGQTAETARQFLQATSWKLEDAIQLFLVGNEGGALPSSSNAAADVKPGSWIDQDLREPGNEAEDEVISHTDEADIRPPLPVKRETLYDDAILYGMPRIGQGSNDTSSLIAFRNFNEETRRSGVWESEQEQGVVSTAESSRDNLASLYRPPFHLMFQGPFEKAKNVASVQDKWLLVNIQSTKEFSSHMLNRDTWANEAVSQTISTNFIFWQVYDDTIEGRKVCTYYKLESIPVVLVIDPITGQKMHAWNRMVQPENLLEDLLPFLEGGPKDHHVTLSHKRPRGSPAQSKSKGAVTSGEIDEEEELRRALAVSMEGMKESSPVMERKEEETMVENEKETTLVTKQEYPPLPEEPKGDRNLLCRVRVRLPDGRRVQRNFLRTDPIQLLWSFCSSQVGDDSKRPFRLTQPIPGASKNLDFETHSTFDESGLANTMISATWD